MTMFGDLNIVFFIPLKTSSYILSTSMRTKLRTASEGKTSSTASTMTYSFRGSPPPTPEFIYTLDAPVFPISMTSTALEQADPPPAWKTVAMSPKPLKCTFFKARLCDTPEVQNMNSLPFQPSAFPRTTASSPMCDPTLRTVQPVSTNLAIFLRFLGYQQPLLMMTLDTKPS